jgi:hypothetical protein
MPFDMCSLATSRSSFWDDRMALRYVAFNAHSPLYSCLRLLSEQNERHSENARLDN